ncbi:MAG: hypothetical protein KY437_00700 [Actinobacteria bacterium]|nr:hypothetical protein [Actinomycetota bacterium]
MKLYAELPRVRASQLAGDAAAAIWTIAWVRAGMAMHDLVAELTAPGEAIERAGGGFAGNLAEVSDTIGRVPVVGDALRAPFSTAADAGRLLESAGQTQQEVVMTLALWLGVIVATFPILLALAIWLPRRVRWIRDASAAADLRGTADGVTLFAHRAVANRSLRQLRSAAPAPGRALASGDHAPLAALELRSLGLAVDDPG